MKIEHNREKLIQSLVENRERHENLHAELMEAYRRKVAAELRDAAAKVESGQQDAVYVHHAPPPQHSSDYEAVLGMLLATEEESITIDLEEFSTYIRDEWYWSAGFRQSLKDWAG